MYLLLEEQQDMCNSDWGGWCMYLLLRICVMEGQFKV